MAAPLLNTRRAERASCLADIGVHVVASARVRLLGRVRQPPGAIDRLQALEHELERRACVRTA